MKTYNMCIINTYLSVGHAAKRLGVSVSTLQRWDREGKLVAERTEKNRRKYNIHTLDTFNPLKKPHERNTRSVCYARVSTVEQYNELEGQIEAVKHYCVQHNMRFTVIADVNGEVDYDKPGLQKLFILIINGGVDRVVITDKTVVGWIGFSLFLTVCEQRNIEVIVLNEPDDINMKNLANDITTITNILQERLQTAIK